MMNHVQFGGIAVAQGDILLFKRKNPPLVKDAGMVDFCGHG